MRNALLIAFACFIASWASHATNSDPASISSTSNESIVVEMLTHLDATALILESVNDNESANTAVELLTPHTKALLSLKQHIANTLSEDEESINHIITKYGARLEDVINTYERERMRIKRQKSLYKPLQQTFADLTRIIPEIDVPGRNFEPAASFVVIERYGAAYTVFYGIPKDIDKNKFDDIRSKIVDKENVQMLSWEEFIANVDGLAGSIIKRNDYPDSRVVDGLICLVGKQPGAPWGLTWNGGIALTRNDYQHAELRYKTYEMDPDLYQPLQDPRTDPVNPGGHLPAFGCLF